MGKMCVYARLLPSPNMRSFLALLAVVALAHGHAVHQDQCRAQGSELVKRVATLAQQNINLRRAAGEELTPESLGLPRSTDDGDWVTGDCTSCIGDIGNAVWDCAGVVFHPEQMIQCVEDEIGVNHDCMDCVCWVIESLLGEGYCDL